jgi:hypothetical protein
MKKRQIIKQIAILLVQVFSIVVLLRVTLFITRELFYLVVSSNLTDWLKYVLLK